MNINAHENVCQVFYKRKCQLSVYSIQILFEILRFYCNVVKTAQLFENQPL